MELKKTPEADLNKKRNLLFMIGLVTALSFVLVAFEWSVFEKGTMDLGQLDVVLDEEEMIPVTMQTPPPPPPPPQTTIIEIVKDDEELEEELDMKDTEIDENTEIEIVDIADEVIDEPEIFTIVEDMPEFPGGEGELKKYLGNNIKYPPMAKEAGITGRVFVSFIVLEDGSISDVKILRGIGGGCDEEALRVVKSMPKWKPGKQRGKSVRVQYSLPIHFQLR
jgi:protein TonB